MTAKLGFFTKNTVVWRQIISWYNLRYAQNIEPTPQEGEEPDEFQEIHLAYLNTKLTK